MQSIHKQLLLLICLLPAALSMPGNTQAAESKTAQQQSAFHLAIQGDRLTLQADNTPLRRILSEMIKNGIRVRLDPAVSLKVTAHFKNREIGAALDRILGDQTSHALVWQKNKDGQITLSEMIIYQPGRGIERAAAFSPGNVLELAVDPKTGRLVVKGRILLQVKDGKLSAKLRQILEQYGATAAQLNAVSGIYEITLPEDADPDALRNSLQQLPSVAGIEPDYAYPAQGPVFIPAATGKLPRTATEISVPDDHTYPVAVLDTGLLLGIMAEELNKGAYNAVSDEEEITDTAGHGTQMALVASGSIAPEGAETNDFANPVISVQIFDENGYTSNAILLRAIDYAVSQGAKVASLSWGSNQDSAFLKAAMDYATAKGLVIVAAAGNEPTGEPVYPAAYDNVLSVSALTADGTAWDQSNYGDFVDVAAPGFATFPVGYQGEPGTYAGTSIATAWVAGKLAEWMKENPEKTLTGVKSLQD